HIQATGVDDAGRKQYLYHPDWRTRRDQLKFDEMTEFAAALPRLRKRLERDLRGDEPSRERVLAGAVRLLDLGFFRVGGERYAKENRTYGLATVKKSHVTCERDAVVFDYRAKGSKRHKREISEPEVERLVRELKRRRGGGEELLAYKDGRRWRDVSSADINAYIKEVTGGEFSAKDFRTWNATVLAAASIAVLDDGAESAAARKRVVTKAVKKVASYLDNTPAVCRSAYIDPRVIDRYEAGATIADRLEEIVEDAEPSEFPERDEIEKAVLELIG
ncbi:MAG: DNA topoisomerase IB, partial [Actinomycetota bacterium]|nr:DNA topoisomerase IB [Actinomycetota bacterium]